MMGTCWLFCLSPLPVTLIFPQNLCLPFILQTVFSGIAGWLLIAFQSWTQKEKIRMHKEKVRTWISCSCPQLRSSNASLHSSSCCGVVPGKHRIFRSLSASGDTAFHPCTFWLQGENNFLLSLVCGYFSFFLSSLGSSIYA